MASAKKVKAVITRVFDKRFEADAEKILDQDLSPDEIWDKMEKLVDWYDEQYEMIKNLYIQRSTLEGEE